MEKEKSQILAFEKASNDKARAVYIGTNYTDEDLIGAAALGNMDAMDSLIRKHDKFFRKIALKYAKNSDMANDVVQDACIKMVEGIKNFKGDCDFTTWAHVIIKNTAFNIFKLKKKHNGERYGLICCKFNTVDSPSEGGGHFDENDILKSIPFGTNPETAICADQIGEEISHVMENLKKRDRMMILDWIGGHTYNEIAETYKVAEGTAKSRIFRIRAEFKRNPVLKQYMS